MPPERQVGLDPLLERLQAQLLQAQALDAGERLARELGERRTAPESERVLELVGRDVGGLTPCLIEQTSEAVQVEPLEVELEYVAGGTTGRRVPPSALRRRDT